MKRLLKVKTTTNGTYSTAPESILLKLSQNTTNYFSLFSDEIISMLVGSHLPVVLGETLRLKSVAAE